MTAETETEIAEAAAPATRKPRRVRTLHGPEAVDVTDLATVRDANAAAEATETAPWLELLSSAERKIANGQTSEITDAEYEALSRKRGETVDASTVGPLRVLVYGGDGDGAASTQGADEPYLDHNGEADTREPSADAAPEEGDVATVQPEDETARGRWSARELGAQMRRDGLMQDSQPSYFGEPDETELQNAWTEGWRIEHSRQTEAKVGDGPDDLFGGVPADDAFVYSNGEEGAAYADGENLNPIVSRLIAGHSVFAHLRTLWANDQIRVLYLKHGGRSRGKPIYTKVIRATPRDAFTMDRAVWLLLVSADHHRTGGQTNRDIERRLFDSLCRMGANDDGNPALEEPDVREFSQTIRVYGLATPELRNLGKIISQLPLPLGGL